MAAAVLLSAGTQFKQNDASRGDNLVPKFQLLTLNTPLSAAAPSTNGGNIQAPRSTNGTHDSGLAMRPGKPRTLSYDDHTAEHPPQDAMPLHSALLELRTLQRGAVNQAVSNQANSGFQFLRFPQNATGVDRGASEQTRLPFLQLPVAHHSKMVASPPQSEGPRIFLLPPDLVLGHLQRNQMVPPPAPEPKSLPLFRWAEPVAKPAPPPPPPPPPPQFSNELPVPLPFLHAPANFFDISSLRNAVPKRDAAVSNSQDAAVQIEQRATHKEDEDEQATTVPINDANIDDLLEQINSGFVLKPGTIADLLRAGTRPRRYRAPARESFELDDSYEWQVSPVARAQPVKLVNVVDIDYQKAEKGDREKPVTDTAQQTEVREVLIEETAAEPEPEPQSQLVRDAAETKVNGALERIRRALSEIETRREAENLEEPASVHPYALNVSNIEEFSTNRTLATPSEAPKRTTLRFADQVEVEEAQVQQKPTASGTQAQRSILKNTLRDTIESRSPPGKAVSTSEQWVTNEQVTEEDDNIPLAAVLRQREETDRRQHEEDEERSEQVAMQRSTSRELKRGIAKTIAEMNASLNSIASLDVSAAQHLAEVEADTRRYGPFESKKPGSVEDRLTRPSRIFRDAEPAPLPTPKPRMPARVEHVLPESAFLPSRDFTLSEQTLPSNDATVVMSETQIADAEDQMSQLEKDRVERKDRLRLRIEKILKGEQVSPRLPRTFTESQAPPELPLPQKQPVIRKPDIFEVHRLERERKKKDAVAKRETTAMALINDLLNSPAPTAPHNVTHDASRRSTEWIANDLQKVSALERSRSLQNARAIKRLREPQQASQSDFDQPDAPVYTPALPPQEVQVLRKELEEKLETARRERLQKTAPRVKSSAASQNNVQKAKAEQREQLRKEESLLKRTTVMYRTQPIRSTVRSTPYDRPSAAQKSRASDRDTVDGNDDAVSELSEWSVDPRVTKLLFDGASATDAETRSEISEDLTALATGNKSQAAHLRNVTNERNAAAAARSKALQSQNNARNTQSATNVKSAQNARNRPQPQTYQRNLLPPNSERSVASTLDSEMIEQYLHGDAETERLLGVGRGAAASSRSATSVGDVDDLVDAMSIDTPGSIIDWNEVENLIGKQ